MAKKITRPRATPKLYACCSNPNCKKLQEAVDFLKLWGMAHKLIQEGEGWYFDVSIPPYWGDRRRERFAGAMAKRSTGDKAHSALSTAVVGPRPPR
jgi:hypothetical protein